MKAKEFAINPSISGMRVDFGKPGHLLEQDVDEDPFRLFEEWLKQAIEKDNVYANAMTLSTVGQDGIPDSRVMLLRNVSYGGLAFFTNYKSKKARDMENNKKACVLFFWKELQRQVRVQGEIRFLPPGESDIYFESRPFESQVGAWASKQSSVIADREVLDEAYGQELKKYEGKKVPRPEYWGGYVLLPSMFEFWQGAQGRLHDRLRYKYNDTAKEWVLERLMP